MVMEIKLNSESSERLFASLCSQFYLKGFVYHSPKYKYSGGEEEIGDVVVWMRDILIVFEIIWKSPDLFSNTKSFIKRVGEKRDQLVRDYEYYADNNKQIRMKNQAGEEIIYNHDNFNKKAFHGVMIVDADVNLPKLHFETLKKSLEQKFTVAIMTSQSFIDILAEVDTPADLHYYLNDRRNFLNEVFKENASLLLDIGTRYERDLIGFYKLNNNSFLLERWRESATKDFWQEYQQTYASRIQMRDEENRDSYLIDEIIDIIRNSNSPTGSTLPHSWELASLTRRARAVLVTQKLNKVIDEVLQEQKERHFAIYNQATGCWLLFYFAYTNDSDRFRERAMNLTRMKMQVERVQKDFKYSVLCYAFRKSPLTVNNNLFDNAFLWLEDAKNHPSVSRQDYELAQKYFPGETGKNKIIEFPESTP